MASISGSMAYECYARSIKIHSVYRCYSSFWNSSIEYCSTIVVVVTVTLAHWALQKNNCKSLCTWLAATVLLGLIFVGFQAYEYVHAHQALDLTLKGGIYGSTFYMLTGFLIVWCNYGSIDVSNYLIQITERSF